MKKLFFIGMLLTILISCQEDEITPSTPTNSNPIDGEWTWYETVQVISDLNGNIDHSDPISVSPLSYPFQMYTHLFSNGIVSMSFQGVVTEVGSYTSQTVTIGNVYDIVSLTSNELVIERPLSSSSQSPNKKHYEKTTL